MRTTLVNAGLAAGLFFLSSPLPAYATTFGPIAVVEQAREAQYVARGQISGEPWVTMEPQSRRPYTYWKLVVAEVPVGRALDPEIVIRQPGGEIGELGYHVAGAATFRGGEDVFVTLRDSPEGPGVKELTGLASGKYKVEMLGGKEVVRNGLGLAVTNASGERLDSTKFRELLERVARKQVTEEDRNVFVNREPVHDHDPELEARVEALKKELARRPSSEGSASVSSATETASAPAPSPAAEAENPSQEAPGTAEEQGTGSSVGIWAIALGAAGLFLGLLLLLRR